jgi:hypothetical protein
MFQNCNKRLKEEFETAEMKLLSVAESYVHKANEEI